MGNFTMKVRRSKKHKGVGITISTTMLVGIRDNLRTALSDGRLQDHLESKARAFLEWLPRVPSPLDPPYYVEGKSPDIHAFCDEWNNRDFRLWIPVEHLEIAKTAFNLSAVLARCGIGIGQADTYQRRYDALDKVTLVEQIAMLEQAK